jgi:hypothetical protein
MSKDYLWSGNGLTWVTCHPGATFDMLGFLPEMLYQTDPRPAWKQFNEHYRHGGGWNPFKGHTLNLDRLTLKYPGDPPMRALAETQLRDERIIVFECAWVVIIQKDGSYEIARMD